MLTWRLELDWARKKNIRQCGMPGINAVIDHTWHDMLLVSKKMFSKRDYKHGVAYDLCFDFYWNVVT